jgi:hypothetical protein
MAPKMANINLFNLPVVIYTHSTFRPFLNIFLDSQLGRYPNKIIMSDIKFPRLSVDNYRSIIYDNEMEYTDRVYHCLSKIPDEWILWTHEIDIPLSVDFEFLSRGLSILKDLGGRRLNLHILKGGSSLFLKENGLLKYEFIRRAKPDVTYIREVAIDCTAGPGEEHLYRFNVNPAIIHVPTFLNFLTEFPSTSYRKIENLETERYFMRHRIFNVFNSQPLRCGHFQCVPEYKILHLTHYRALTHPTKRGNDYVNEVGYSMYDVMPEYSAILARYGSSIDRSFFTRFL